MIIAKNDRAHLNVSEQIKNHEVKKTYRALVRGVIKENSGTINMPIARSQNDRTKMAVSKNGKEAITHFKVLKRYQNYTYIEVNIETGRTHQIRVHMAYIGYPVTNDPLYGRGKTTEFGQMLHSYSIKLHHPRTGIELFYTQEPPKEFLDKLEELQNQN